MNDFSACDLLIVVGTSLTVGPFNSLMHRLPSTCPRLLVNLESVGEIEHPRSSVGFDFEGATGRPVRDVRKLAPADEAFEELCELLGWTEELIKLRDEGWRALDAANGKTDEAGGEERQKDVLEAIDAAVEKPSEKAASASAGVDELTRAVGDVKLERREDEEQKKTAEEQPPSAKKAPL